MREPRFEIRACPQPELARLRAELGVSDALAQVLVRRGHGEPQDARRFLAAADEHSPHDFERIDVAVELIAQHVRTGSRITVHGDYDVDGVCSTAVLIGALRGLGAEVDWYLPDRRTDGYGLSEHTVRRLAERGTRLLLTADCGITAVAEIELARALGLDVVVSDHHAPRADGRLPRAPIVHPGVCRYPFEGLCATAVAYKLAQALWQAAGRDPSELEGELDLVALATIADVVPLLGENRSLVRRGLRTLAGTARPGLRALMAAARVDPSRVDERSVAFGLAPRLNAAGRMDRADAGLELILTADPARAARLADALDRRNHERRGAERAIRHEAEAQIAALPDASERRALVLAGDGWHAGVIGIVASRLAEQHNRPVVMIALDGERGRGSGRRGSEAFDLLGGLRACAGTLIGYGGHSAAAGLEIERARVPDLAAALDAHARAVLDPRDMAPIERVDALLDGRELSIALAEELARLGPFGQGNPTVSLMLRDASFADVRPMGEGRHARFSVRTPTGRARGVAFHSGGRLPVAEGEPAEATFALEVNEWRGASEPRLVLRRARAAGAVARSEDRRHGAPPARTGRERGARQELVLFR